MILTKCMRCGNIMLKDIPQCPNCGKDVKQLKIKGEFRFPNHLLNQLNIGQAIPVTLNKDVVAAGIITELTPNANNMIEGSFTFEATISDEHKSLVESIMCNNKISLEIVN